MDYTLTELKGEYPSNYPDSKKYVFRVKDYPNDISAFSKFPMKNGDSIHGNIEVKGQYHNFKFAKKIGNAPTSTGFTEFDREMIKGIFNNVNAIRKHLIFGPEPKAESSVDDMPF